MDDSEDINLITLSSLFEEDFSNNDAKKFEDNTGRDVKQMLKHDGEPDRKEVSFKEDIEKTKDENVAYRCINGDIETGRKEVKSNNDAAVHSDTEDLNIISVSCLFGGDFLKEEIEHIKGGTDDNQIANNNCDVESGEKELRSIGTSGLQSVMRNKLFKMSKKEVVSYLSDVSLGEFFYRNPLDPKIDIFRYKDNCIRKVCSVSIDEVRVKKYLQLKER